MERKYSRGECNYEATYKSHLTKHIQSVHMLIKYKCTECGNTTFIKHKQTVHVN